jgi:ATP-dependent helicase/nuclease subunit B
LRWTARAVNDRVECYRPVRLPLSTSEVVVAPRAADRIAAARAWLDTLAPGVEALVIAPSQEAADDLVRAAALARGASFALQRLTLNRLAGLLAADCAAADGLAYVSGLGAQAVATRALYALKGDARLVPLGAVLDLPGLPKAIAATHADLSHALIEPHRLAENGAAGGAIAAILEQFDEQLRVSSLIDRAGIFRAAITALGAVTMPRFAGVPTLLLDVPIASRLECDFVRALAARVPGDATGILAMVPAGDYRSLRYLCEALDAPAPRQAGSRGRANALARVQEYLFAETTPEPADVDDSVTLCSAAGEMQECVEIARRIHAEARRGVPFDRIAVLLHAPARYAPYLEEALTRAGIPAWFARGVKRPEPGGRAFLALLNCAAEHFSARRFAEYLSLAQAPEPPAAEPAAAEPALFTPADPEFMQSTIADAAGSAEPLPEPDPTPTTGGAGQAPWRWERILVEASVIGGRERWAARLSGLEAEWLIRRSELENDDPRALRLDREMRDLAQLRTIALAIIGALAAMPAEASWGEWLVHLRALAEMALRDRAVVLAALAELEPMGPIGGITLDEVRLVLRERLGRLEAPPARRRYGAVFIAPTTAARGFDFAVTIVPGLAERVLPQKLIEDPLLPDATRRRLSDALPTQADRAAAERLALRVAVGAASERVALSYPRVDLDQGRPRVPSFYTLEILRAAEGRLPGFDELPGPAARESRARLGWPVPKHPADAIDDAEFDLALLDRVLDGDPAATLGALHYLLDASDNPHLGRALRARARRWRRRWSRNDGLVDPDEGERAALARHQLPARSYSATALQHFAACPYRFFLQAIIRLEPRKEIEALEAIDPLTRGGLYHEVQFETLTALRARAQLPIRTGNLDAGYAVLEEKLIATAANYHDRLAPAIERVWLDGIESIRADLREWMRRMAEDPDGFCPERFELSFGLSDRDQADPASVAEAVPLDAGFKLRGSIDLVERGRDGALRVTDHKTGRVRAEKNLVIGGGKTLQPALYALAAERMLPEPVSGGRLYYCTAAGGYEERVVPLDTAARAAVAGLAQIVHTALEAGFMPAAPGDRECDYCDYRLVCGPSEQTRVRRKSETAGVKARLADLTRLREMR